MTPGLYLEEIYKTAKPCFYRVFSNRIFSHKKYLMNELFDINLDLQALQKENEKEKKTPQPSNKFCSVCGKISIK